MPKVLTDAQVETYQRDGCLVPVRAMSAERARHYRERFEALEARVPDIKKMKTKSHLLCPWVLEIAEDPHSSPTPSTSPRRWTSRWRPARWRCSTTRSFMARARTSDPTVRFLLLVEMLPTWAAPPRVRQSTMLVRGVDTYGNFDDEPRPDGEWTPAALAGWSRIVEKRARLIFEDSRIGPSEAYGGTHAAT
jgi:hypothetical protein